MISDELSAHITRLALHEKWTVHTIAKELKVHHSVVRRVLGQEALPTPPRPRPRLVDPYVPFLTQTLEKYPGLCGTRLYRMVQQRGYRGKESHFRHILARLRPRPAAQAYLRVQTLPGEEAQVDWASFGKHPV